MRTLRMQRLPIEEERDLEEIGALQFTPRASEECGAEKRRDIKLTNGGGGDRDTID